MRAEGPPSLLHIFPSFVVGGAQMRFASLANQFGDEFSHDIIAMDGRLAARDLLHTSVPVRFPQIETREGNMASRTARFVGFLRTTRPHRLITSNWGSIDWAFAKTLSGTRHVHMEDGFGPEERDRQLPRRVLTRRAILRHSDILLPSHTLLNIAERVWRLPERRLHHIPNGIDLSRFVPRNGPRNEIPIIGTIAALRAEKNIARLIDAFAILRQQRPAKLVIVGGGSEADTLKQQSQSLGLAADVDFPGHSPTPERFYHDFDIFALSSDTEQMPLSVLEAMAAALPIAATNVGDVASMVAETNRPFIVEKSSQALADSMLRLLAQSQDIGAANRQRAERHFSAEAMFHAHHALWTGRDPQRSEAN